MESFFGQFLWNHFQEEFDMPDDSLHVHGSSAPAVVMIVNEDEEGQGRQEGR